MSAPLPAGKVAKLASGLFDCWSLLRNNSTAINPQTFTSSFSSRRFSACDQGSHCGFSTQICFSKSTWVSRFDYEKSRSICFFFWSDKFTSNFNVFNNVKITLYYSVCMRTSGERVRMSDEAERVQSVSYP